MSSPVPLALESMRGRSTLRLVGVIKTTDIRLDLSNEVSMYVLALCSTKLAGWATSASLRWLKPPDASRSSSIVNQ